MKIFFVIFVFLFYLSAPSIAAKFTLPDILDTVLKTNEQIQIARTKLDQTKLLPWRAIARVTPQLYVQGTTMRQTSVTGNTGIVVPREQQTVAVILRWPIWQFEILSRVGQGNALIVGAQEELSHVVQDIAYSAASAYLELLKAVRLKALADEFVRQAQTHLKIAKAQYRVGETRKTALLQAELDLIQAEKRAIEAEHSIAIGRAALRAFVPGLPEDFETEEWQRNLDVGRTIETLASALEIAQKNRHDLKSLASQAQAADAESNAATMRLLPTLSIDAHYQNTNPVTVFTPERSSRVAGVVSIPLFQGGEEWLSRADLDLVAQQAKLRLASRKKEIEIEVRQAFLKLEMAKRNQEASQKAVEITQENFRLFEKSFKEGLTSSADLTDAHAALMEAEFSLATEEYNLVLAVLGLQKVTGVSALGK